MFCHRYDGREPCPHLLTFVMGCRTSVLVTVILRIQLPCESCVEWKYEPKRKGPMLQWIGR